MSFSPDTTTIEIFLGIMTIVLIPFLYQAWIQRVTASQQQQLAKFSEGLREIMNVEPDAEDEDVEYPF